MNYNEDSNFLAVPEVDKYHIIVPDTLSGQRLDIILAKLLPDFSRSRLASWIKQGNVWVDGKQLEAKTKLIGGEKIEIQSTIKDEDLAFMPEQMNLDIVFEDDDLIVLNKPAGLVVHPAAGNWQGTLLNGLLFYCPSLKQIPRAGIVHRLDKDTSGLMVIAKTFSAHTNLVEQLQQRSVKRIYRAVADGVVPYDGKIETLIGRNPHNRLKMAVVKFGGKEAITHIKVLERYQTHSYVECSLETGRTHQIRVHMREARHPLSGDPLYGNVRAAASEPVKDAIKQLGRQALHAFALSFDHPTTKERVSFETTIPEDIHALLSILRLESGKDSQISSALSSQQLDGEDDWDEDEYDVEVIYVPD